MNTVQEKMLTVIRLMQSAALGNYSSEKFGRPIAYPFITYGALAEALPEPAKNERRRTETRDDALAESNRQDIAAGRPLLTAVAVRSGKELPGKEFFTAICARDNVKADTWEEKMRIHNEEYLRTKSYPWQDVVWTLPEHPPICSGPG